ncbi:hypothetical protein R1flu_013058 [Riccia fluitans]|uniref:Uncharacterized protein n=1 Tax=Riccia fluitans TaxID=41844 RepID=A0ABD1ZCD4_9MARC
MAGVAGASDCWLGVAFHLAAHSVRSQGQSVEVGAIGHALLIPPSIPITRRDKRCRVEPFDSALCWLGNGRRRVLDSAQRLRTGGSLRPNSQVGDCAVLDRIKRRWWPLSGKDGIGRIPTLEFTRSVATSQLVGNTLTSLPWTQGALGISQDELCVVPSQVPLHLYCLGHLGI